MLIKKYLLISLHLLVTYHVARTFVILSANIADVKKIAKEFSGPLANEIVGLILKATKNHTLNEDEANNILFNLNSPDKYKTKNILRDKDKPIHQAYYYNDNKTVIYAPKHSHYDAPLTNSFAKLKKKPQTTYRTTKIESLKLDDKPQKHYNYVSNLIGIKSLTTNKRDTSTKLIEYNSNSTEEVNFHQHKTSKKEKKPKTMRTIVITNKELGTSATKTNTENKASIDNKAKIYNIKKTGTSTDKTTHKEETTDTTIDIELKKFEEEVRGYMTMTSEIKPNTKTDYSLSEMDVTSQKVNTQLTDAELYSSLKQDHSKSKKSKKQTRKHNRMMRTEGTTLNLLLLSEKVERLDKAAKNLFVIGSSLKDLSTRPTPAFPKHDYNEYKIPSSEFKLSYVPNEKHVLTDMYANFFKRNQMDRDSHTNIKQRPNTVDKLPNIIEKIIENRLGSNLLKTEHSAKRPHITSRQSNRVHNRRTLTSSEEENLFEVIKAMIEDRRIEAKPSALYKIKESRNQIKKRSTIQAFNIHKMSLEEKMADVIHKMVDSSLTMQHKKPQTSINDLSETLKNKYYENQRVSDNAYNMSDIIQKLVEIKIYEYLQTTTKAFRSKRFQNETGPNPNSEDSTMPNVRTSYKNIGRNLQSTTRYTLPPTRYETRTRPPEMEEAENIEIKIPYSEYQQTSPITNKLTDESLFREETSVKWRDSQHTSQLPARGQAIKIVHDQQGPISIVIEDKESDEIKRPIPQALFLQNPDARHRLDHHIIVVDKRYVDPSSTRPDKPKRLIRHRQTDQQTKLITQLATEDETTENTDTTTIKHTDIRSGGNQGNGGGLNGNGSPNVQVVFVNMPQLESDENKKMKLEEKRKKEKKRRGKEEENHRNEAEIQDHRKKALRQKIDDEIKKRKILDRKWEEALENNIKEKIKADGISALIDDDNKIKKTENKILLHKFVFVEEKGKKEKSNEEEKRRENESRSEEEKKQDEEKRREEQRIRQEDKRRKEEKRREEKIIQEEKRREEENKREETIKEKNRKEGEKRKEEKSREEEKKDEEKRKKEEYRKEIDRQEYEKKALRQKIDEEIREREYFDRKWEKELENKIKEKETAVAIAALKEIENKKKEADMKMFDNKLFFMEEQLKRDWELALKFKQNNDIQSTISTTLNYWEQQWQKDKELKLREEYNKYMKLHEAGSGHSDKTVSYWNEQWRKDLDKKLRQKQMEDEQTRTTPNHWFNPTLSTPHYNWVERHTGRESSLLEQVSYKPTYIPVTDAFGNTIYNQDKILNKTSKLVMHNWRPRDKLKQKRSGSGRPMQYNIIINSSAKPRPNREDARRDDDYSYSDYIFPYGRKKKKVFIQRGKTNKVTIIEKTSDEQTTKNNDMIQSGSVIKDKTIDWQKPERSKSKKVTAKKKTTQQRAENNIDVDKTSDTIVSENKIKLENTKTDSEKMTDEYAVQNYDVIQSGTVIKEKKKFWRNPEQSERKKVTAIQEKTEEQTENIYDDKTPDTIVSENEMKSENVKIESEMIKESDENKLRLKNYKKPKLKHKKIKDDKVELAVKGEVKKKKSKKMKDNQENTNKYVEKRKKSKNGNKTEKYQYVVKKHKKNIHKENGNTSSEENQKFVKRKENPITKQRKKIQDKVKSKGGESQEEEEKEHKKQKTKQIFFSNDTVKNDAYVDKDDDNKEKEEQDKKIRKAKYRKGKTYNFKDDEEELFEEHMNQEKRIRIIKHKEVGIDKTKVRAKNIEEKKTENQKGTKDKKNDKKINRDEDNSTEEVKGDKKGERQLKHKNIMESKPEKVKIDQKPSHKKEVKQNVDTIKKNEDDDGGRAFDFQLMIGEKP